MSAPTTPAERNRPRGEPRVKGNAIEAAIEFVRTQHPDYWEATLGRVQPATRDVVTGVVVASAWYPFDVHADFASAFCELLPGGVAASARAWGAWTIDRDFQGGIYRVFLRAASPRLVIKAFGRFWGLYHGSGAVAVLADEDRRVQVLVHGVWRPGAHLFHGTMAAGARLLELSGTGPVRTRLIAGCGPDDRYAEWEMSW